MLTQIGIGIPTRDRWDELGHTLEKLEAYGLGDNETIVLDDGSREPAPVRLRQRYPKVRFERVESSRYVTGGRNDLARMLSTPLFLQVDNDSYPIMGDLAAAAAWLQKRADALALAFVIAEREDYKDELRSLPREPVPCHYFIGCGALIKRELFLELGGYDEILMYSAEEVALTLHAQARGHTVYLYPEVIVFHHRSPVSRDVSYRASLAIRNELIIAGLYYPWPFLCLRWPTFMIKAVLQKWFPLAETLKGAMAAAKVYAKVLRLRNPARIRDFLRWKAMMNPVRYD